MKSNNIIVALIIGIAVVLSVYIYTYNNRFELFTDNNASLLKLNKMTGEVRYLSEWQGKPTFIPLQNVEVFIEQMGQ